MAKKKNRRNKPTPDHVQLVHTERRARFDRMRRSIVAIAAPPLVGRHYEDGILTREPAPRPTLQDSMRILGTGFAVYADGRFGVIMTAYHVIEEWVQDHRLAEQTGRPLIRNELTSMFVAGSFEFVSVGTDVRMDYFKAEILGARVNESLDVAAILIQDPAGQGGARIHPAPISQMLPEDGDEIVICGFPLGNDLFTKEEGPVLPTPSFSAGIVSAALPFPNATLRARRYFRLNALLHRGNSGSPVFDITSGEVVGVVATSLLDGGRDIAQPVGFGGATYALAAENLIAEVLKVSSPRP